MFIVDMLTMNLVSEFDVIMTEVFSTKKIVGMSFHSDLSALSGAYPELHYFKSIPHLYDVQKIYAELYAEKKGQGLSKIVDAVVGTKVCKVEQMGNWEKRPLRKSQLHYGALDAYILVELYERMSMHASESERDIDDYTNPYSQQAQLQEKKDKEAAKKKKAQQYKKRYSKN